MRRAARPTTSARTRARHGAWGSSLAVYLTQNNVQRADNGDHVGDQVPANHFVERLQIDKRRRPNTHTIGLRAAVADNVITQDAFGAFDGVINLPWRGFQNFSDACHDRARGNIFDGLQADKARLAHLFDAHHVAVVGIAVDADRNFKFVLVVGGVRHGFAEVPLHATRAQHRPAGTQGDAIRGVQQADVTRAAQPDAVAREQVGVFLNARFKTTAEAFDVF